MNKYTNIIRNLVEAKKETFANVKGSSRKAGRKLETALRREGKGKPNNTYATGGALDRYNRKSDSRHKRVIKQIDAHLAAAREALGVNDEDEKTKSESVLTFGQLLDELTEMKKTVASWQSGVRSSQLSGIPSSEQFKDADFAAGYGAGMEKGTRAMDPSYRAKRVANKAKQIARARGDWKNAASNIGLAHLATGHYTDNLAK